jgi:septal ring factor EnvC (AmiA/AmiB activator)
MALTPNNPTREFSVDELAQEVEELKAKLNMEQSKSSMFEGELKATTAKLAEIDKDNKAYIKQNNQIKIAYINKAKETEKNKQEKDQCMIISLALTFLLLMLIAFTIAR